MRTLLLVQHCQSQHHINRQADLWPDIRNGLTELGRSQAQWVARRLRKELAGQPCRIYTSQMQRALETAQIIGECIHAEPQTVADLHEFNGQFAMARTEAGPERVVDNSNWSLFDWRPSPEAETWRQFHARVCTAMEQLARGHPAECVAIIVTHGGTLSNIVTWWLRLPLDVLPERTPFAASPGSISILKTNKFGKPVIDRLNDSGHLDVAGLAGGLNLSA